ncbi:HlyIII-domain-containing protein [Ascodesmis nigricans]|uniref:HlyIII-domain-containing protein n=1 Tax=Ascodesmis nigricans TaxID=341454 RepID=A0A4S2MTJ3_9PEZI|nr:HlyIII-domain-containing protein [Ascodesmis nigricans]
MASATGFAETWDLNPAGQIQQRGFRRSSIHHHARHPSDIWDNESALLERVDTFITELERRLDQLEKYGNLKLDEGIEKAWATLQAVRDECGRVSGEVLGEGKRRAHAIIEILEERYQHTLDASSLPGKVSASVHLLEELLLDFEARAQASLDRKLDRAKRNIQEAKSTLQDSIERAIAAAKTKRLITYDELPIPWRVNPHILTGYRFNEKKKDCVHSALFSISNETCNIWSHGLGFLLVMAIAFYFYPTSQIFAYHTTADRVINGLFFLAAGKALACSTVWHTMSSISEQTVMERFACVDYSGISLLIAVSIMTTEYTAFYYEPISRACYMGLTLLFGITGVILPWRPIFNEADMRVYRVAFYICLAATGTAPLAQLMLTRGVEWTAAFYLPILKSLAVYLVGATVYALQVPERWWPGAFDWVGGSHNIFHVMVVAGIVFHWVAMQDLFRRAWGAFEGDLVMGMGV